MSEHDTSRLLREATHDLHDLTSDVDTLVRGGIARGRTRRRRRRGGTALAAVAVVGVIGAAASVGPRVLDDAPGPANDRGFAAPSGAPASSDTATTRPGPAAAPPITVSAEGVPAVFGEVLGGDVGEIRRDDGYGVRDRRQDKIVHFMYDGTLTTFVIERADTTASCSDQVGSAQPSRDEPSGTCEVRDGVELLVWGPVTNDGVTAQGVSAWTRGYVVSALSYNAADGKEVPTVTGAPPIPIDDLVALTTSDVWFAEPASGS